MGASKWFYIFSATGNCKYAATRLVQAAEQEMSSIVDCPQNDQYAFSGETIGIISPTYVGCLHCCLKLAIQYGKNTKKHG